VCSSDLISYGFVKTPVENRPVFVNDQTLRAFSDGDIEKMLSEVLICDAQSTQILIERGFGRHLGIRAAQWKPLNEVGYAYEGIVDGQATVYGIKNPRMSASRCSDKILLMQPDKDSSVRTVIRTGSHTEVAPGAVVHRNSLGGTVVSTAYPLGRLQFYMGYFNVFRKVFWRELLFEVCNQASLAIAENHPLRVYRNCLNCGTFLGIINPTLDQTDKVILQLGSTNAAPAEVKILSPTGKWQLADIKIENFPNGSQRWTIKTPVEPLKAVYIHYVTRII